MNSEWLNAVLAWIAANPAWMGLIIFLTALSESLAIVGMLVPGALMLFGFGALIALGQVEFWAAYGWAVAGAVTGDGLSFWLGRFYHQRLRRLWPFSRHPEMLARSEVFFQRHGGKSVLFGRFFGPVRAVIPAVAGMLDMPTGRFLAVNIFSAFLWAPAYLLPGMVFGASLQLASQVAWRLATLLLVLAALLWLTVHLVHGLFRLLQPHVNDWLRAFSEWSYGRRFIGPVAASLLDPAQGEWRGLTILAALLAGSTAFIGLAITAGGRQFPTALDQSIYHFLQDLRTPWADGLMVAISGLGDYQVVLPLIIMVFLWLYWRHTVSAALHWLAAAAFGLAASALFSGLFQAPRPMDFYQGAVSDAFPVIHATLITLLFGFLAVLMARETRPARRWIVYVAAALIVIPITFARLYLGLYWFTDALAGLSLGLVWVTLLGLAYSRHPAPPLNRLHLAAVSLAALTVSELLHAGFHYSQDVQRYQVRTATHFVDAQRWRQEGWQELSSYRVDFQGHYRQAFDLQWASSEAELNRRLQEAGWRPAPSLDLAGMLMWLNPQARLELLPVLPRVHDGRHEDLTLVRAGDAADQRWVLRFWDTGWRLTGGELPIWLGSLTLQSLARRMNFFAFAIDIPPAQPPLMLLAPALAGLPTRLADRPGQAGSVLLTGPATQP